MRGASTRLRMGVNQSDNAAYLDDEWLVSPEWRAHSGCDRSRSFGESILGTINEKGAGGSSVLVMNWSTNLGKDRLQSYDVLLLRI